MSLLQDVLCHQVTFSFIFPTHKQRIHFHVIYENTATIIKYDIQNVQNIIHPVDAGWVYSSEKYESPENTCRKMFLHIVLYCGHLRGGFCLMQRTNVASQRNSQNKLMLVPCRRDICVFNKKMNTIFSRYGPQNRPSDVDLKARNTGLIKATDPKKNCPRYQE